MIVARMTCVLGGWLPRGLVWSLGLRVLSVAVHSSVPFVFEGKISRGQAADAAEGSAHGQGGHGYEQEDADGSRHRSTSIPCSALMIIPFPWAPSGDDPISNLDIFDSAVPAIRSLAT